MASELIRIESLSESERAIVRLLRPRDRKAAILAAAYDAQRRLGAALRTERQSRQHAAPTEDAAT